MKLLSVALPRHDANMAWFDGQCVRYIKTERTRQEKRFSFAELADWRHEAERLWGPEVALADDTVFSFDPGALPPALRGLLPPATLHRLATGACAAEPMAPDLCAYLGVRRGWFASHHLSHALSGWMLDAGRPGVQIVIDGLGDGRPWSVYRDGAPVAMGDIRNGSIGWGIREAGKLLGVRYGHYNDIAGKVMGLQSYGTVDPHYLAWLDRFGFEHLRDLWSVDHWYAHKGDALVGKLTHLDWIATVHHKMGDMLVRFFQRFAGPGDFVAYSGGVAQNVVWNALLRQHFPRLAIPPHCSDEGLSLGGLEWLRQRHGLPALRLPGFPWAQSDAAPGAPSAQTIDHAARLLAQGRIVGWYQGHGEIGPRALGNRSILMDPRIAGGRRLLNRVKQREDYRPFGASVLQEHFGRHFTGEPDAFMLLACGVVDPAALPVVTHVDHSSRVQAVDDSNAPFRALLERFFAHTGCPVLVNTSLNLAGKPIAASPDTALQLLAASALDAVVIGDRIHCK